MPNKWKELAPLGTALLIAAALKYWLWIVQAVPFNSDEAVVALMARHILQGARPVFFYGQAYMGSLDAWLIAGAFRLFGETVGAVRLVQALLYLIYTISIWGLARCLFSDRLVAEFAVLVSAIPPVMVTTYTTATLGNYNESIIFGVLILGIGHALIFGGKQEHNRLWLLLGLVGGLAFWTLGIAGVYLLPVALIGLWRLRLTAWRGYLLATFSFFLGSLPWWLYNLQLNWAALWVLRSPANISYSGSLLEHFITLFFFSGPALLGLRGGWMEGFFPLPLLAFGLLLTTGLLLVLIRSRSEISARPGAFSLLAGMVLTVVMLWLLTSFGIDVSGRYLLPLHLPLVLAWGATLAVFWKYSRRWSAALLVLLLAFNFLGTFFSARSADKITTQFDPITRFDNRYDDELIAFLEEHGEWAGYSNYWVAFRLAFLSDESLNYAPELPDKADLSYTPAYNRYLRLNITADQSERTAYITTLHPELNEQLRIRFTSADVTFQESQIGPYHIFYALNRPMRPEELGFGDGIIR